MSIPFFDAGGVLADNVLIENDLIKGAIRLAENLGANAIDLRHNQPLRCMEHGLGDPKSRRTDSSMFETNRWYGSASTKRVRLSLDLLQSPEALFSTFKSKLRSQIRKPMKEGLTVRIGHLDLVDEFYEVFAQNMRDLGSPVHAKRLIIEVLREFSETAWIFVVDAGRKPIACSLCIGFKDTMANPWASSLRRYRQLSPNMLLYWAMLEFACQRGYEKFDFGRSSPGEGTYKFKEQWGAKPQPLYWYQLSTEPGAGEEGSLAKDKMSRAIEYWKRLPVLVTKTIGPRIRRYISL